ncbi:hypothetical protein AX16_004560 [Volvariella volvacea WC 439]|nr:hypothetical protein AX16_004560 [Volvariella volvacea WC 439]
MIHFQLFESVKKLRTLVARFPGHGGKSKRTAYRSNAPNSESLAVEDNVAEIRHQKPINGAGKGIDPTSASPLGDLRVEVFVYPPTCSIKKPQHIERTGRNYKRISRDDMFYFWDSYGAVKGNKDFCVFQAGNVLFRVHQFVLCQEDCAFRDMFNLYLPQNNDHRDEGTHENPIHLDDTADQFRDLLWALYAYSCPELISRSAPTEHEFTFTPAHIQRLTNIALLSNKYCIASYQSFSINLLHELFSSNGPTQAKVPARHYPSSRERVDISQSQRYPWNQMKLLAQVLDVAVLCQHDALQAIIERTMINRILSTERSRGSYVTGEDIKLIQTVAEKRGLRRLLGVCYYQELISLDLLAHHGQRKSRRSLYQNKSLAPTSLAFPSTFDPEMVKRFSLAYQSLSGYWNRHFQNSPPSFTTVPTVTVVKNNNWGDAQKLYPWTHCRSHAECLRAWENLWFTAESFEQSWIRDGLEMCNSVDVLKRLEVRTTLLNELVTGEVGGGAAAGGYGGEEEGFFGGSQGLKKGPGMNIDCSLAALERLTQVREEIIDGLLDHFVVGLS